MLSQLTGRCCSIALLRCRYQRGRHLSNLAKGRIGQGSEFKWWVLDDRSAGFCMDEGGVPVINSTYSDDHFRFLYPCSVTNVVLITTNRLTALVWPVHGVCAWMRRYWKRTDNPLYDIPVEQCCKSVNECAHPTNSNITICGQVEWYSWALRVHGCCRCRLELYSSFRLVSVHFALRERHSWPYP